MLWLRAQWVHAEGAVRGTPDSRVGTGVPQCPPGKSDESRFWWPSSHPSDRCSQSSCRAAGCGAVVGRCKSPVLPLTIPIWSVPPETRSSSRKHHMHALPFGQEELKMQLQLKILLISSPWYELLG